MILLRLFLIVLCCLLGEQIKSIVDVVFICVTGLRFFSSDIEEELSSIIND